jgi:hypothetical protein
LESLAADLCRYNLLVSAAEMAARCRRIIRGPKKTGTRFIGKIRIACGEVNIPSELEISSQRRPNTCHETNQCRGRPELDTRNQAAGTAVAATTMSLIPTGRPKDAGSRPCEYFHNRKLPPSIRGVSPSVSARKGIDRIQPRKAVEAAYTAVYVAAGTKSPHAKREAGRKLSRSPNIERHSESAAHKKMQLAAIISSGQQVNRRNAPKFLRV